MLRRLIIAALVGLQFAAPAAAITPDERPVLFGGGLKPTVYTNFLNGPSSLNPAYYTYSGASLRTITDATGTITYAPNNLLLNTASLSTQGVTVGPFNYILSYYGSGSVALSGTCAGTPSGSSPAFVKFTATAGTCTLTVTGSVTNAVLAAVTYETSPRSGDAVVNAGSAYYGPAFDYDPNTHAPLGLRVEESRTNLITYSGAIGSTNWVTAANTASTLNNVTSPDGTTSATFLNESTTTLATHSVNQTVAKAASSLAYSYTVYAKPNQRSRIDILAGDGTNGINVVFDLAGAQVGVAQAPFGTGFTVGTSSATSVGNGWVKCTFNFTSSTATSLLFYIYLDSGSGTGGLVNSYAGTVGYGAYVWGSQIEQASFPTSYIPTGASSVARAADIVSIVGPALAAFQRKAGSVILETSQPQINANAYGGLYTNPIAAGPYLSIGTDTAHTGWYASSFTLASLTANVPARTGLMWSGSNMSASRAGGAVTTTAASDYTATATSAQLGVAGGATSYIDGYIRQVAIYTAVLTNQQLQARTVVGGPF